MRSSSLISVVLTSVLLSFGINPSINAAKSLTLIQQERSLTLPQIKELILNKTPDTTISLEIEKRGILFKLNDNILKELHELGAGPKAIQALKASKFQVTIENVLKLSPKTGEGVGYDVVLKNDYSEEILVDLTEVSGVVKFHAHGMIPSLSRVTYEVQLDSIVADPKAPSSFKLQGSVYDSENAEWGAKCQGILKHKIDTSEGVMRWDYSFSVPSMAQIPPKGRISLRLLFKRNSRRVIEKVEGNVLAASFRFESEEHTLIIKLRGGDTLVSKIDREFLKLIATWPE